MPELRTFPVFGEGGRIGTLTAAARFLDSRSEKTVRLDNGNEISVPADALTVRPDGSFYLRDEQLITNDSVSGSSGPSPAASEPMRKAPTAEPAVNGAAPEPTGKFPDSRLFREGYSIERVQVDRIVSETPAERHEGDTLVLPVVEEVLVMEKRLMLREEIRITRRREPVQQVRTIDAPLQ